MTDVVLGVDIGTTGTKAVAFDVEGGTHGSGAREYGLEQPEPGWAVQDPEMLLRAVREAVGDAVGEARGAGVRVAGLAFSSAMHGLIALDGSDRPLTPALTWADGRALEQAERLRASREGLALHRCTGTPVHPMSPLVKLMWFAECEPGVFAAARRWVDVKSWVLAHLTGEWVTDHSMASGSGLLALETLDWDPGALALAGIDAGLLPELVPVTHAGALREEEAGGLGLEAGLPVVAGAGDGPLANLGLGAVHPGVAACSIGTSGALRVMVEEPAVDSLGRVFCYALTPGRWVVGGAINNGGSVLDWARHALAPDLGDDPDELLAVAARAPAGCDGLVMLPYLLSERAPHWSPLPRGAYVGLTRGHGREHLVRAALEGVCLQLAIVLDSMRDAGNEVREVRATGGFARSGLWRQMLADALGIEVGFPESHEGSSFGAALLGAEALGLIESWDRAADLVQITDREAPNAADAAVLHDLKPLFASLYDALGPAWATLRRLAPAQADGPARARRPV